MRYNRRWQHDTYYAAGPVCREVESISGEECPVNIREEKDHYDLRLYAAGLHKEGFRVSTQGSVLVVAYQPSDEIDDTGRYTLMEFMPRPFTRRFLLNGQVKAENMQATYQDGILRVRMNKSAPAETAHAEGE